MRWYEVLALDELQLQLQRRLRPVAGIVLQDCDAQRVFPTRSEALTRISGSSHLPELQIKELLLQLIAAEGDDVAGPVFKRFCHVLDMAKMSDLADKLQEHAAKCKQNMNPSDVPAAKFRLESPNVTWDRAIRRDLESDHGVEGPSRQQWQEKCVERVQKHHRQLCEGLRRR